MTIDNLKCFILVAENLSFARAAEALYISQPAVAKQINTLEHELGVALFIRSTRHVELTPSGMSFYKDAKDIVMKSEAAITRVQKQYVNSDSIRIGLSNPAALFFLTPVLTRFHSEFPDIRPDIECPGYKIVLNLFLENKLDVLFYYRENMPKKTSIHFIELQKDRMICLMPKTHPFAGRDSVSLEDLKDTTIIACNPLNAPLSTSAFQRRLSGHHAADKILYCNSIEIAHCLAASGFGISVLPQILTLDSPEYAAVPLSENIELSFGVFYHKRNTSSALDKFLKLFSR
ncbi:DNA-binding transcriptional regulator, LysR family [Marvinbryantia formatexigens]|nr:DNA-binding transcriptional regulator, LysR family [Marvinbryantia formatexigens]